MPERLSCDPPPLDNPSSQNHSPCHARRPPPPRRALRARRLRRRRQRSPPLQGPHPDHAPYELGTCKVARLGFPLLTLGLLLGALWGKVAWGDYWNWDPKELWSLVSWLVYVAYFHSRLFAGLHSYAT